MNFSIKSVHPSQFLKPAASVVLSRTPLLLFALCYGLNAWAQNVTTLTPTPFAASGDVAVDSAGNIFVANAGATNHDGTGTQVYKVSPAGEVSLFADGFSYAVGNAFDSAGNLYQSSYDHHSIFRITPDGSSTLFVGPDQGINAPGGLTFDSVGNLYVTGCSNNLIRRITPGGMSTVFYSQGILNCPSGLTSDDQNNLYVTNFWNTEIVKITPSGAASVFADTSALGSPGHNANIIFANERLYVAGTTAHRVFELSLTGELSVLAGNGERGRVDGPLLEASLTQPTGIDVSPDGSLLYVNTGEASDSWNPNVLRAIELPGFSKPFEMNVGLNDAWYDPVTDGQGFFITVLPDLGFVLLSWFTYDTELPAEDAIANLGDAGHRWLIALGTYVGNTVEMEIDMTSGGIFDTTTEIQHTDPPGSDGTITLTFDGCNSGTVEYDITSVGQKGIVPIQRVANDNIVLCEMLSEE